jgi:hypothetical protein
MNTTGGWDIDTSWVDETDQAMREGMLDLCEITAEKAADYARKFAPNPRMSRGYALGALAASGYMISKRKTTYYQHILQARRIPGTRIVVRGQILGKFPIESLDINNRNKAFAVMAFPLAYAEPIRTGFHHRKSGKFIIGVDYITSAVNRVNREWENGQRKLVREVEKIAR